MPNRTVRIFAMAAMLAVVAIVVAGSAAAQDADDAADSLDAITVTATRIASLIRDEPLRVEAVPADEIEENLTEQPGNLTKLLNELPSVRMQATAPGLGGVGLQLRGMPTRDTLVLTDGLPLLGAEPDGFGLLQTPPLDLERVEVIKGAASALYGGSALGGVLNLVSRTPAAGSSALVDANSHGGGDLLGFLTGSGPSGWSGTLTAGAHNESRTDPSGEGWAELPGYRRYALRPRLWWQAGRRRSLFLTAGYTDETRDGGTMPGRVLPEGFAFAEGLRTRRWDGGAVDHWSLGDGLTFDGRGSFTSATLDQTFGAQRVAATHTTGYGETALGGKTGGHAWILGLAFEHDALAVAAAPGVGYRYDTPAVFAQDEVSVGRWLKFAGSARVDAHSYGTFFSPRLSALLREPGNDWSLRASVGGGFAAPTPFVDQIEATSLAVAMPLRGLRAERAITESLDAKWADGPWDLNASLFDSVIRDPLQTRNAGQMIELINAPGARRAPGAEVLIHYVEGSLEILGSWSAIDATEVTPSGLRQSVPLVPRQSAEIGAILESERRGRIGMEVEYTGRQALEDDPYRAVSEPYVELNALGEVRFGGISVFANALNLTDTRQTRFDPLLRPALGPGGNPITDTWAPLGGRTFNAGLRLNF